MQSAQSLLRDAESVLVAVHQHADLDSTGSAVGLADTLPASVTVAVPSAVQQDARPLLDRVETVEGSQARPEAYDLAVVVDTPSVERVEASGLRDAATPLVVVDHHEPDDLADTAAAAVVDTDAEATSLLVAQLLDDVGTVSGFGATALVAGILDDTGGITSASPAGVETVVDLLARAGDDAALLAELFDREVDFGERVATAKALARADGYKAGQRLLLITRVGSQESAAARALVDGGADIALVLSARSGETWVVGRTADRTGGDPHLPDDVFTPLVETFGGHGGGHAGAGVAKLATEDVNAVETACLEAVESALGVTFGSIE